jgi:FKBP-type peptidyl-prolyl cis-trans isomerase
MTEKAKEDQKKEQAFFEANGKTEGVVTTESGVQYKIISQGAGIAPSDSDKVMVQFTATSLNGKNEIGNGNEGPEESRFNESILSLIGDSQVLKEGGKIKLFIPGGVISANAAIVYVDLLKVSK